MSQHISGEVGNTIRQDNGEFITSGTLRIRKSLIVAYMQQHDLEKKEDVGVKFLIGHGWIGADFDHDGTQKELQRLDWIFKKEYGVEK